MKNGIANASVRGNANGTAIAAMTGIADSKNPDGTKEAGSTGNSIWDSGATSTAATPVGEGKASAKAASGAMAGREIVFTRNMAARASALSTAIRGVKRAAE